MTTWLPDPTRHPGVPGAGAGGERGPLTVLYRGPLTSCNYDCGYCPFAKAHDSPATLAADKQSLERFVAWALGQREHRLAVLFTPWGEALTRSWYREAMVELSHCDHVDRVAVQTNAAARMGWTERADLSRLALWTTFHPGETSVEQFARRSRELVERGVRHSVGVVGLPEHLGDARALRAALDPSVYLWINAADGLTYDDDRAAEWTELDPLFEFSRDPHPSAGRLCSAGLDAITVDGAGDVRRCHFLDQGEVLGNVHDGSYLAALAPRACPKEACDCHIGYVHLDHLGLREVFAGGLVERIPAGRSPA